MSSDSEYHNFITDLVRSNDLMTFKSNPVFRRHLEHVPFECGKDYLDWIIRDTTLSKYDIIDLCQKNDRIGGGVKSDYGFITTSPSNFRYIFQAHLILKHIKELKLDTVNIVEIGGGYGGLCLIMTTLNSLCNYYGVNIKNYTIIDFNPMGSLQKRYLQLNKVSGEINYYNSSNCGLEVSKEGENFLVSNYSFSELSPENMENYKEILFPKIKHGFMTWNSDRMYDFGMSYRQETEFPLTYPTNKYLFF